MVGAFPRKEGMERKDLLTKNIEIFKASWFCTNVLTLLRQILVEL